MSLFFQHRKDNIFLELSKPFSIAQLMSTVLSQRIISDPELGDIYFNKSQRAKHINISILEDKLKVTLPMQASEKDAMKFINSVREKILKKQAQVKVKKPNNKQIIDEQTPFKALTFVTDIKSSHRENIYCCLKNQILSIEIPFEADCREEKMQNYLRKIITYYLRIEAKRVLPKRTRMLADKFGFKFSTVKIQSSRTRWGSCSAKGNINLSLYLMALPAHLIDYVILHELCHTKELNHSPNFWRWMNSVTDNQSDQLKEELKNFNFNWD